MSGKWSDHSTKSPRENPMARFRGIHWLADDRRSSLLAGIRTAPGNRARPMNPSRSETRTLAGENYSRRSAVASSLEQKFRKLSAWKGLGDEATAPRGLSRAWRCAKYAQAASNTIYGSTPWTHLSRTRKERKGGQRNRFHLVHQRGGPGEPYLAEVTRNAQPFSAAAKQQSSIYGQQLPGAADTRNSSCTSRGWAGSTVTMEPMGSKRARRRKTVPFQLERHQHRRASIRAWSGSASSTGV